MDYAEALEYISSRGRFGVKLGLEQTRALLAEAGDPHLGLRGVLVAGTNGKGSVCAFLTSILRAAGLRVGGMPKPHLVSYTERICVDGEPLSEAEFAAAVDAIRPAVDRVTASGGAPTEFEMLTAAAVLALRDREVDLLVCEVGMGGRLDSTNVLDLGVKVITTIALDHMQWLGADLASIAGEKAGIIHAGDAVVTGALPEDADAVIARRVVEAGAGSLWRLGEEVAWRAESLGWDGAAVDVTTPVRRHDGLRTRLLGRHQGHNAAVAVAAADALALRHGLELPAARLAMGLAEARWPGRLELFRLDACDLLLDGGHNPAAVATVVAEVADLLGAQAPAGGARPEPVVLFGAMEDKDRAAMLGLLPPAWPAVLTAVEEERAEPAAGLLATARELGRADDEAVEGVPAALSRAIARAGAPGPAGGGRRGMVLVLGSLYLAGAVRQVLTLEGVHPR